MGPHAFAEVVAATGRTGTLTYRVPPGWARWRRGGTNTINFEFTFTLRLLLF